MKKVKLFDLANNDQVLFIATTDDDGNPCIEQTFFHHRVDDVIKLQMIVSFKEDEFDIRDDSFIKKADHAHAVKFSETMLNLLNENNG